MRRLLIMSLCSATLAVAFGCGDKKGDKSAFRRGAGAGQNIVKPTDIKPTDENSSGSALLKPEEIKSCENPLSEFELGANERELPNGFADLIESVDGDYILTTIEAFYQEDSLNKVRKQIHFKAEGYIDDSAQDAATNDGLKDVVVICDNAGTYRVELEKNGTKVTEEIEVSLSRAVEFINRFSIRDGAFSAIRQAGAEALGVVGGKRALFGELDFEKAGTASEWDGLKAVREAPGSVVKITQDDKGNVRVYFSFTLKSDSSSGVLKINHSRATYQKRTITP